MNDTGRSFLSSRGKSSSKQRKRLRNLRQDISRRTQSQEILSGLIQMLDEEPEEDRRQFE